MLGADGFIAIPMKICNSLLIGLGDEQRSALWIAQMISKSIFLASKQLRSCLHYFYTMMVSRG